MKKLLVVGLVIISFTIVIISLPAVWAQEADFEKYFPLNEGNSWTYLVSDAEGRYEESLLIKGKEMVNGLETVKRFEPDGEYECIAADSEGIRLYKEVRKNKYEIYHPPFMILPNKKVGESLSYSINSDIYLTEGLDKRKLRELKGTHQHEITVESMEDVEVPAGVFTDCIKVSETFNWKMETGNYGQDLVTLWFAPGVGRIKEFTVSMQFDAATGEEHTGVTTAKLNSAIIDGKEIGKQ